MPANQSNSTAISPTELSRLALEFKTTWNSTPVITMTPELRKGEICGWQLKVNVIIWNEKEGKSVPHEAMTTFPNYEHQTMLGAILRLLHNVDSQVDAYNALLALGA